MFEKKQFNKITIVTIALAACLLVLSIIFSIRAFRSTSYIVYVEDKIYDEYIKTAPLPQKDLGLIFVKESERNQVKEKAFGPIIKTAGRIQMQEEIALLPQAYGENQKFFVLEEESLLPSVKADFTSAKSGAANSPELSISISNSDGLPLGNRAIPVDGAYAGDESYKLLVKKGILCTVFEEGLSKDIFEYCEKLFIASENSPEKKTPSELVTIASVGDIMVARGVEEILIEKKNGLEVVFEDTLPILKGADFTIGNLEGVVTESWKNATKTYTFKFKKAVLPKLLEAGFDYLMQTNNTATIMAKVDSKTHLRLLLNTKFLQAELVKTKRKQKSFITQLSRDFRFL